MTAERLEDYRVILRERRQILARVRLMLSAPKHEDETQFATRADLLSHYYRLLSELEGELLAVEQAIEALPYGLRLVMRYHYVEGLTWEQVAEKADYSVRGVYKLRDQALTLLESMELAE